MPRTQECFDLIIFDCDGTLVDSESLNIMAVAQVIEESGLSGYTQERIFNDFSGQRFSNILQMISENSGFVFPNDILQRMLERVSKLAPTYMKTICDFR
jgi:phosphoglycolate phosphatase-like HAD superfamily hydrolase